VDQKPLISVRQPEHTGSQVDSSLEHARLPAVIIQFESEGGGSGLIFRVGRECFGRGIPMSCQLRIGVQEKEPITIGGFRPRRELTATPSWGVDDASAMLFGCRFGKVARAAVDDYGLSDAWYRSKRLPNGGGGVQNRNNDCKVQCDLALRPLNPAERGRLIKITNPLRLQRYLRRPGVDAASISAPAEMAETMITLPPNQNISRCDRLSLGARMPAQY
jgi:hypothetical protein